METKPSFTIMNALKFAFYQMKTHFKLLIEVGLPGTIIALINRFVSFETFLPNSLAILIDLTMLIINLMLMMGFIRITLDIYDKGTSSFNRMFTVLPLLGTYCFTFLLYSLIVIGGLILLIIPGIYFAIKYSFAFWYVVDTGCGALEALRKSAKCTKGNIRKLSLLFLTIIGIILLLSLTSISLIMLTANIITHRIVFMIIFITIVAIPLFIVCFLPYILLLSYSYIFRKLEEAKVGNIPVPIDVP